MLAARPCGTYHIPFAFKKGLFQCRKVHMKRWGMLRDPTAGRFRVYFQADSLVVAQREAGFRNAAVNAVVAANSHVPRLQQDAVTHGKAGFKAAVDAEIDLQHTDLCAPFRIGLHFQPQQQDTHAVKQSIIVDLSVTGRLFKAVCLCRKGRAHTRFVMKNDVDHTAFPNPTFTICIFIMPSPTLARKRKKPLTDGSFRSW